MSTSRADSRGLNPLLAVLALLGSTAFSCESTPASVMVKAGANWRRIGERPR